MIETPFNERNFFITVAFNNLNLPYIWGGDDPLAGYDCSGFVIECLKSVGMVPESYDNTANGLSKEFVRSTEKEAGNLVFYDWNNDGIIDHVAIILYAFKSGEAFVIEAGGGNSKTLGLPQAIHQNAFVRVRPLEENYKFITSPFGRLN